MLGSKVFMQLLEEIFMRDDLTSLFPEKVKPICYHFGFLAFFGQEFDLVCVAVGVALLDNFLLGKNRGVRVFM